MDKEKFKMKRQGAKEAYVRPEIGFAVLEDPCMVFTSWGPHQTEGILPVEEEEEGLIPDEPKGAKAFDAWEVEITDNTVDFKFSFKENE